MLGSVESEKVRLISREIIFAEFQHIWPRHLNVTDWWTDGRTTCLGIGNTIPATLRAVKSNCTMWLVWCYHTIPVNHMFISFCSKQRSECNNINWSYAPNPWGRLPLRPKRLWGRCPKSPTGILCQFFRNSKISQLTKGVQISAQYALKAFGSRALPGPAGELTALWLPRLPSCI